MLDRALFLFNILVGSCGGFVFLLWLAALVFLLVTKTKHDAWSTCAALLLVPTLVLLIVGVPVLSWLYIAGVFS